jgi:hypothetical protein
MGVFGKPVEVIVSSSRLKCLDNCKDHPLSVVGIKKPRSRLSVWAVVDSFRLQGSNL